MGFTLLILALGIGFGSRQLAEISQLQQQADSDSSSPGPTTSSRRRTISSSKEPATTTIARLTELEPYGKEDSGLDRRQMDALFKIQIATLSSSQSEEVARQILTSEDEPSKSEIRLFRYCLLALADEHPQATLDLIEDALESPFFSEGHLLRTAVTAALTNLGIDDFETTQEWLKSRPEIFGIEQNKILRAAFQNTSSRNYGEALSLIDKEIEGDLSQTWAMYGIHSSLTMDGADDLLSAVRNSELSPDLKREALEGFGTRDLGTDVKTITDWISQNELTYEEIRGVLGGLGRRASGSQAEWINWIAEDSLSRNRFSGAYQSAVRNLLSSLVQEDLVKTGQLINSLPTGSKIEQFAKSQYANHMSSVDLEVAIKWFETLPENAKKTETGRELYHKYFRKNPALAEEFAIKNNLYVD